MTKTAASMTGRLMYQLGLLVATLSLAKLGDGSAWARSWSLDARLQHPASIGVAQQPETADLLLAQDLARPTLRSGSVGDAVSELQAILKLLGFYDGPVDGFYRESTQAAVGQFQTAVGISADGIVGPSTWQKLLPNPGDVPTADIPEPAAPATSVATTPQPSPAATSPTPASPPAPANPTPPATTTPAPASRPESSPPQPVAIDLPVLRQGMFGPAVTRLQERLTALGAYKGPIDGIFGSQTAAAVEQIQRQNDLTVDGVVGPVTWSVIFK